MFEYSIHQAEKPSNLKRFFNFDEFLTTRILKVVHFLGALVILLGALALGGFSALAGLFAAFSSESFGGTIASAFLLALCAAGAVTGLFLWRVYCELVMVIFKINENLQAINDAGGLNKKGV
jgi:hypothetical protein